MKTFQEFITEGRDAPLYHGTSLWGAVSILKDDLLRKTIGKNADWGHDGTTGVSFTRRLLRKSNKEVMLEFNQRKLAQRYKIDPHHNQVWEKIPYPSRQSHPDEMEEKLILPDNVPGIPVTPFLIGLYLQSGLVDNHNAETIKNHPLYRGTYDYHPRSYNWTPGK